MKRRNTTHVHVKIDTDLWAKAVPVIREMGFTQSGFFELMIKRFLQADSEPMGKIISEVLQDVINAQVRKQKRARS